MARSRRIFTGSSQKVRLRNTALPQPSQVEEIKTVLRRRHFFFVEPEYQAKLTQTRKLGLTGKG